MPTGKKKTIAFEHLKTTEILGLNLEVICDLNDTIFELLKFNNRVNKILFSKKELACLNTLASNMLTFFHMFYGVAKYIVEFRSKHDDEFMASMEHNQKVWNEITSSNYKTIASAEDAKALVNSAASRMKLIKGWHCAITTHARTISHTATNNVLPNSNIFGIQKGVVEATIACCNDVLSKWDDDMLFIIDAPIKVAEKYYNELFANPKVLDIPIPSIMAIRQHEFILSLKSGLSDTQQEHKSTNKQKRKNSKKKQAIQPISLYTDINSID